MKNELNICNGSDFEKALTLKCEEITKKNRIAELKKACHNPMCACFEAGARGSDDNFLTNCLAHPSVNKLDDCINYRLYRLFPTDLKKLIKENLKRVKEYDTIK